jgi:PST family polysaccharide transporter
VSLGLLALVLSPLVGEFFQRHEVGVLTAALAAWVPLRSAAAVPDALMQRRFSFWRRVVVDPAGVIAFGVVSVVTCANGMGAWGLLAGTYASAALRLVLSWGLARWRPNLRLASFGMWLELARFGRHVLASGVVWRFTSELPGAVVGRWVGTGSLGQYRYGERFGMQPQAAVTNVASYVLLPAFARISLDPPRLRRAFLRGVRWLGILSIPAGLIMLPLGEPIAVILLGDRWRAAGQVMMALCVFTGARSLVSISSELFKAVGRPHYLLRMHLVSAASMVAAIAALLTFGLVGVAAGVSVSAIIMAAYAIGVSSGLVNVPRSRLLAELWPPALASALMVAAVWPLDRLLLHADSHGVAAGLALLAVEALGGLLIYVASLQLLSPTLGREVRAAAAAGKDRLRLAGWPLGLRRARRAYVQR